MARSTDLEAALAGLGRFLDRGPLTDTIGSLEHALEGCTATTAETVASGHGILPELLYAGMLVRDRMGRVNDVIHAATIALALPRILEPGDVLRRPSLAAGNDPSRPYDVESDRRIAEFKVARWAGNDTMRKRQTFKDLVHLAADESGRSAELYVLGERPLRFLETTRSTASWGLDRVPAPATSSNRGSVRSTRRSAPSRRAPLGTWQSSTCWRCCPSSPLGHQRSMAERPSPPIDRRGPSAGRQSDPGER